MSPAPPPPAVAAEVFGASLPLAARYADLLATEGLLRGVIGPHEPERIWARHLLNSAALAPYVPNAARVADVGAGAGLPGIPLLLARPRISLTLVEPLARRVAFLREAVAVLGLDVEVVRSRAEALPPRRFDTVVVRAVARLPRLVQLCRPLLTTSGTLLALKGASVDAEVRELTAADPHGTRVESFAHEYEGETTHVVRIRWTHR